MVVGMEERTERMAGNWLLMRSGKGHSREGAGFWFGWLLTIQMETMAEKHIQKTEFHYGQWNSQWEGRRRFGGWEGWIHLGVL